MASDGSPENAGGSPSSARSLLDEANARLPEICAILRRRTGHDFTRYKRTTILRRVHRRMQVLRLGSVATYLQKLEESADEADLLFGELLINVTRFFRDADAFAILEQRIIPAILGGKERDGHVRVWVPGCASGEEAYSIAMLLQEQACHMSRPPHLQVFASDIDDEMLAIARHGRYPETIAQQISPERLQRFFQHQNGSYQVTRELRDTCLFSRHDVTRDPPFSCLDLVSCRNLLIYMEAELQKKLLPLFHYALLPGGYLFLGPSESVASHGELFVPADKKHRLYRRKDLSLRSPIAFPAIRPAHVSVASPPAISWSVPGSDQSVTRAIERVLLEQYAPAGVVVNEQGEIAYFMGPLEKYLTLHAGAPSASLLNLARPGLRSDLRSALHRVAKSRRLLVQQNLAVDTGAGVQPVNLIVRPLSELGADGDWFLAIFQDAGPLRTPQQAEQEGIAPQPEDSAVQHLENELRTAREKLQTTVEDLEAANEALTSSNEELISMNEELQSANEELQTSKEEVQSANEELGSVNEELQRKLEELNCANSDLQNLFQSTQIATIFLDRQLRITRYTPASRDVFRLIGSDVGRPITDIAPRFIGGDLTAEIRQVLSSVSAAERPVCLLDGHTWFIMRILPYRTLDNAIDGVVLTFTDITELKKSEAEIRSLARFPKENPNPVIRATPEGLVLYANDPGREFLGRLGWSDPGILPEPLRGKLAGAIGLTCPCEMECPAPPDRTFLVTFTPLAGEGYINLYASDITERKQAQQALEESEQRVRRKLQSVLSPEGDLGILELADLIDVPAVQKLMEDFYAVAHIPMSIIDLKGQVLVGVGWQDICTRFHRVHPQAKRHCLESDTELSAGLAQGQFRLYKCKNNLWDIATPIFVGGQHLGNIFSGQFFFDDETPDYDLFRTQGEQYAFDPAEYLAALDRVPRLSRDTVNHGMSFFLSLAQTLSQLGYSNVKLARLLAERDRLTHSIREREERLRLFIEHAPAALAMFDSHMRYISVSRRWLSDYGLDGRELHGLSHYEVFPEITERWKEIHRRALAGEVIRADQDMFQRANGVVQWLQWEVRPWYDPAGRVAGIVVFSVDITQRKAAEETLRQSEAQLRAFFQTVAVGAVQVAADGRFLRVNDRFCQILGYSRDELLGMRVADLSPAQHRAAEAQRLAGYLAGGGADTFEVQKQYVRKDGQIIWANVTAGLVRDAEGKPLYSAGVIQDVTERKAAAEALQRASERLALLSETAGTLLASADPQALVQELCCKVMRHLDCDVFFNFLVDPKAGRLRLNAFAGISAEEAQRIEWLDYGQAVCGCVARDGCRVIAEEIAASSDPRTALVKSYGVQAYCCHPMMAGGRLLGTVSFGAVRRAHFVPEDIELMHAIADQVAVAMERLDTVNALRDSELRFRRIYENAATGIATIDWQGRFEQCNAAYCAMLGYAEVELLQVNVESLFHPDDREENIRQLDRLRAGEMPSFEIENRYIRKDGQPIWVRKFISALREDPGKPGYIIALVTDISVRKAAEEALRRYQLLARHTRDIILFVDRRDGRLLEANEAAVQAYGYTREELLDLTVLELRAAHTRAIAAQQMNLATAHGAQFETVHQRKDGSTFPVEVSSQGAMVGDRPTLISVVRDITERKAAEAALRTAMTTAEQARAAAESANHAKDHFLAVLSHELRTPLTPALTTVYMLRDDPRFGPETQQNLEVVRRNIELEARLIDDLLDVTRIGNGKTELNREPTELLSIIRRAFEVCLPDAQAKELTVATEAPDAPYPMHADPARLQQVFWNLIKNAIKFTPRGGRIGIRCRREDPQQVVAEVYDTGVGIAPEVLPRLFNAFEQGDRHTTRQFGGLGLGLAISKALTELHGGTLTASSQGRSKGATFVVRLPLCIPQEACPGATHSQSGSDAAPPRPLRILLVEDHADTARIMRRLLAARGHVVHVAGDVAAGVQLAPQHAFDLILSDLGLPDGSGLDLLRILRANGIKIPAIAISGYGQEHDIQQTREAGFAAHLVKPTNPHRLMETIAQVAMGDRDSMKR